MRMLLSLLPGLSLLTGIIGCALLLNRNIPALKMPEQIGQEERIQRIDSWLQDLQKANKFNGAVLLAKGGKPLLAKGYGFTNYKKDTPLTAQSSFRLASLSKQFTAVGIMILKEQGKLEYDDLVTKYITNLPYKNVTIRHLLNQTSGIPDIYLELAEKNKQQIDLLTNQLAVELLIKENQPVNHAPNSTFEYSNTNYILLARLIEVITNQSFETFMQEALFEPLNMKNTRVWNLLSTDKTFTNKTDSFKQEKGRVEELKPSFVDGVAGDGGVFSSVEDLMIWDQFWYGNELLHDENLKEAFLLPTLTDGSTSDYGFGWIIAEPVMWHDGAWLGANTMIFRDTERKICLIVLDNSSNLAFDKIVDELF